MIRLLLFAIAAAWLAGCAPKEPPKPRIVQNPAPFFQQLPQQPYPRHNTYINFLQKRYTPWQLKEANATVASVSWAVRYYATKRIYGENRLPLPKRRYDRWVLNANYDSLNTLRQYALTIRPTSLRLFPSMRPIFFDPSLPGEGYPFDYNQNSAVKAFTPLIISHLSRDGGWAFVQTPFALGWLPMDTLAYPSRTQMDRIVGMQSVAILKEEIPIYDGRQNFLFYAKMATLFPFISEEEGFYRILVPKKAGQKLLLEESLVPVEWAHPLPLDMTPPNVERIVKELLEEPYGWGGMVGNRDCSAMTRDFFIPFGIWLPRNSKAQAKIGKTIDLSELERDEKERKIIEVGVPFQTLLYMKGHIMLYIGSLEKKAYVMHNLWGIRTANNGRHIIGRAVVTDLYLGENLPDTDPSALLIEKIVSMNIVTE